jgi:cytoskeleton-associated protein 5
MIRNDIKPALMTTVEAEFEKNPKQAVSEPARTSRAAKAGAAAAPAKGAAQGVKGGRAAAAVASAAFDPDDLLPREDISGQISSKLIAELGSANWKERKAAMDEVEGILAAAGNRIQPNVRASPTAWLAFPCRAVLLVPQPLAASCELRMGPAAQPAACAAASAPADGGADPLAQAAHGGRQPEPDGAGAAAGGWPGRVVLCRCILLP